MIYIGVDPGKDGAMAIIWESGGIKIVPFSPEGYRDALAECPPMECCCCLERVGPMPKQGVTSMFKFGENFGFIQGLLTANRIPFELVTPQKWKKEFQITGDKNSSIAVCKRLFPDVSLRPTDRHRKDHDGMAEALLMACYAQRRM